MITNKLTPRENSFVAEYIANGMNMSAAAVTVTKLARTSAKVWAARAMKRKVVIDAIRAHVAKSTSKTIAEVVEIEKKVDSDIALSTDITIREVTRIAFSDVRKLVDADGKVKELKDIDDATAAAIASIEIEATYEGRGDDKVETGRIHKVKFWDKGAAQERLLKFLSAYPAEKPQEHRILGLQELLRELNAAGETDTGIGPARSRRDN